MPRHEPEFTQSQRHRLDEAERELNMSVRAHRQMRGLLLNPEWSARTLSPNAPTMQGDRYWLERDLEQIAIKTLRVYIEAFPSLGSVEPFRTQLKSDASRIMEWIRATVNKEMGEEHTSRLIWDAIEQRVDDEVANQINKAERDREITPPWSALDTSLAAAPAPGSTIAQGAMSDEDVEGAVPTKPDQVDRTPRHMQERRKRKALRDDPLLPVKQLVRTLMSEGAGHRQITKRLGAMPRPVMAAWANLSWDQAYKDPHYRSSVSKWLSKHTNCSDINLF